VCSRASRAIFAGMYKRYYPTIITLASVGVVLASLALVWGELSSALRDRGWPVAAGVGAVLAFGVVNALRRRRQLSTRPLPASSVAMLEELERQAPLLMVPHRQQFLASSRAFIHAAYGDFEAARAQLESVS
jgi:hypothetical protein